MANGNTDMTHPVAEMVQQGLAVMRMENETQMQMAAQKPRDESKVLSAVMQEMDVVPDLAATYFYSIPYRKEGGGTENVRGLSIKAAMSAANRWGNCAVGARVVEDAPDRVRVEGVFLDYETNTRILKEVTVAKKAWRKNLNQHVPLDPTRLQMAIQAGMSKATRNAILARMPEYIKHAVFARAVDIASGKLAKPVKGRPAQTVESRIDAAIKKFVSLGAVEAQVRDYIAGLSFDSNEDVLADLIGVYNAITDGQTTVQDVFGQADAPPEARKGDITLEDVVK